jgi:hypothetical protein
MPIGWAVTVVVLCVVVVVLSAILIGLMRQIAPVLERAAAADRAGVALQSQGPPVGQRIPDFAASGPDGTITAERLHGQPAVLLFLSVGCGPCAKLADEMRGADLGELTDQLVIVTGPDGPRELGLPTGLRIATEAHREISEPLLVVGTPLAVALDAEAIVRSVRVTNTLEQLSDVAATVTGRAPRESSAHLA